MDWAKRERWPFYQRKLSILANEKLLNCQGYLILLGSFVLLHNSLFYSDIYLNKLREVRAKLDAINSSVYTRYM